MKKSATNQPENASQKAETFSSVTFRATIPCIETAIKVHGEGGARMILDIAESDLAGFLTAVTMRGKRLTVTLQEDINAVR